MDPFLTQTERSADELRARLDDGELTIGAVLSRHLFDPRPVVRRNAVLAAAVAPPLSMVQAGRLDPAVRDDDPVVRQYAMTAMARSEASLRIVMPALLQGLADTDKRVHQAALAGVRLRLEREGQDAARMLVNATGDAAPFARISAAYALQQVGPGILDAVIEGLGSPASLVRSACRKAVRAMGEAAIPKLIEALRDPATDRRRVAKLLVAQEPVAAAFAPQLEALRGEAPDVEGLAIYVLNQWDKAARARAAQPIEWADPWFYRRVLPDDRLRELGQGHPPERILASARDGRPAARANAARLTGLLGCPPAQRRAVLRALRPLTKDEDAVVRREAVRALGALSAPVAPLLEAARDPDDAVSAAAVEALGQAAKTRLTQLLGELARGIEGGHYGPLVHALVAAGPKVHAALAVEAARHPSPLIRELCVRTLGAAGDRGEAATEALMAGLGDEAPTVRARSARAMLQLGVTAPAALGVLKELSSTDPERVVRTAAYRAHRKLLERALEEKRRTEPSISPAFLREPLDVDTARREVAAMVGPQKARGLQDGRPLVRRNTAAGLAPEDIQGETLRRLFPLLQDPDDDVRVAAAEALARSPAPPEQTIPALLRAIRGARPHVEGVIGRAIASYGEAAHGPLLATLGDALYRVESTTGRVAPLLGAPFTRALAAHVAPPHEAAVRRRAAGLLGILGPKAGAEATAALTAALADPVPSVRLAVIDALSRVAPPGDEVESTLRATLVHERRASVHRAVDRALRTLSRRSM